MATLSRLRLRFAENDYFAALPAIEIHSVGGARSDAHIAVRVAARTGGDENSINGAAFTRTRVRAVHGAGDDT
jgi:hypothetical protein